MVADMKAQKRLPPLQILALPRKIRSKYDPGQPRWPDALSSDGCDTLGLEATGSIPMSRTIRWCCAATLLFAAAFAPTGVSAQMGVQQVSPQTDAAACKPYGLNGPSGQDCRFVRKPDARVRIFQTKVARQLGRN